MESFFSYDGLNCIPACMLAYLIHQFTWTATTVGLTLHCDLRVVELSNQWPPRAMLPPDPSIKLGTIHSAEAHHKPRQCCRSNAPLMSPRTHSSPTRIWLGGWRLRLRLPARCSASCIFLACCQLGGASSLLARHGTAAALP